MSPNETSLRPPAVRIGMLGAGYISNYHLNGLQAAGANVVSIFGRNPDIVRSQAERFGIENYTTDASAILERDDIDGVIIATPDHTHEELAIAALRNGKAVLVQKPIARTVAEARRMIEAAEKYDALLCVSYMHRYFEEVQAVQRMIRDGEIGDVVFVRQRNATPGVNWASWQYQREFAAGGVVVQLGIHGIDLLTQLFGRIEAVFATTSLLRKQIELESGIVVEPEIEDFALCLYRFESGLMATHEMSFNEVGGTDRFRMEIDGSRASVWLRNRDERLVRFTKSSADYALGEAIDLPAEILGKRQHEHFIAMMRKDMPDDDSARDSLYGMHVTDAIYRSAESGTWQNVDRP